MTTIIAGFTLGLFGSLHCVGMCGPLALALPSVQSGRSSQLLNALLYNFGRVITYSLIGFVVGILGKSFQLSGLQQLFSITAGSVMLFFLVLYFGFKKNYQPYWFQQFTWKVQKFIGSVIHKNGSALAVGMANGLLPCGMVYAAIAGALVSGSVLSSVVFMSSFGAATIPAMAALMIFGSGISMQIRIKFRNLTPYVMMIVAALLILRGMNLGIPYISPQLQINGPDAVHCH